MATTREQLQSELEDIKAAMHAVTQGGQSYRIGSRQLTRASYSELRAAAKEIEARLAALDAGNGLLDDAYVAVWPWDR